MFNSPLLPYKKQVPEIQTSIWTQPVTIANHNRSQLCMMLCHLTLQYTLLADFLSLSDTFDEHSLLRHHDSEHSTASKETSTNRSRIMSNATYAPPEYVFNHLSVWMLITTRCMGSYFKCIVWQKHLVLFHIYLFYKYIVLYVM